jgi:glycosyltransferase involved in cell wall biosynthesis
LLPGVLPDVTVTVSEYVARRQREVGLVPASRVTRVWNGIPLAHPDQHAGEELRAELGIGTRPLVACACRASPVKGVHHLLAAFDLAVRRTHGSSKPVLVYAGDGPQLDELRTIRDHLGARNDIYLLGYRTDAAAIVQSADVCVVPSVWQDALPLSVLEPMAAGCAVIASAVGGIPEMILDGETGLLVPPGDESALAEAISRLLAAPDQRRQLGMAARERVARHFSPETQIRALTALFEHGLGLEHGGGKTGNNGGSASSDTRPFQAAR